MLWIVLHVEQKKERERGRESESERGAINVEEEDERRKQLMAFVFAINAPIALLLLPSLSHSWLCFNLICFCRFKKYK